MPLLVLGALFAWYFFAENGSQIKADLSNWGGRKLSAGQARLTARRETMRKTARTGVKPWVARAPGRVGLAALDAAWGAGRSIRLGTGRARDRARTRRDEILANRTAVPDPDPARTGPEAVPAPDPIKPDSGPGPVEIPGPDPARVDVPAGPGPVPGPPKLKVVPDPEPTPVLVPARSPGAELDAPQSPVTPEAIPAAGPIITKESRNMDVNNVEGAKASLEKMRANAVANLEDKKADVARAVSDAADAEVLAVFADWAEAPEPYRAAMKAVMENPPQMEAAANAALVSAEKLIVDIDKALAENAKQMQVAETMAAAGGGMKREAYAG